jgi:glucose-6-phosphate isomerase
MDEMKRFEDTRWIYSMRIRMDFNNLMEPAIDGAQAEGKYSKRVNPVTREDINKLMPKAEAARLTLSRKWGRASRMMAWTRIPTGQDKTVADILHTANVVAKRFDSFVVFGIGGSALGSIAVHQALNHLHYNELTSEQRGGRPKFYVEDNVDPERMAALLDVIDIRKTCFNIITKSGSTSETMSQFIFISDLLKKTLGNRWTSHLICTTDKRKGNLIKIAKENHIKTFFIPDGVGGRFSVFCPVGLLPAAVCGIDIEEFLAGAAYMEELCQEPDLKKNPGWLSGMLMYLCMKKKDKNIQVMMPYADSLKYIADWYAQLWAESLGKKYSNRKRVVYTGQTPVKSLGVTDQHSQVQLYTEGPFDKVITFIGVDHYRTKLEIPGGYDEYPNVSFLSGHTFNDLIQTEQMATEYALARAGKLNQTLYLPEVNAFTIGQLLYFFMVQAAVTGELLGINAFDQPGVEEGKNATYALFGRPGYEAKKAEMDARPEKDPQWIL